MIVAEAFAGGVTVDGLTVQTGVSVKFVGDTWQLRSTVPLKPLTVPTVMFADDVPPGATASGDSEAACRVKFWADAPDDKVSKAAHRHRAAMPQSGIRRMNLDCNGFDFDAFDFNDSDFNGLDFSMSRFRFNYLRFIAQHKGCPARRRMTPRSRRKRAAKQSAGRAQGIRA